MNTNSIPNINLVEPQIAERLKTLTALNFPVVAWESAVVFPGVGAFGLVNRDVEVCHLPCGRQILRWFLPGNTHPVPLEELLDAQKTFKSEGI